MHISPWMKWPVTFIFVVPGYQPSIPKVRYSEDLLFGLWLGLGVRVKIEYVRNSGPLE